MASRLEDLSKSVGVNEPINGSWIQALAVNYYATEPINGSWIQAICKTFGVEERSNTSWIQALAEKFGQTNIENGSWLSSDVFSAQDIPDWDLSSYTTEQIEEIIFGVLTGMSGVKTLDTLVNSTNAATGRMQSGSVLAPNGRIYTVPSNNRFITEFDPETNTIANVGSDLGTATAKYYGGCLGPDGKPYFIGDRFNEWIRIDPETGITERTSTGTTGTANWTAIITAPNGYIYAIPRSQPSFVKIDPDTNTHTFVGSFLGTNKFRGACLGFDGKIYCIPRVSSQILVLDPVDDSTYFIEDNFSYLGGDKWQGGSLAPNGKIYCMPVGAFANGKRQVLVIDTINDVRYTIPSDYQIAHCITGPDGNIYGCSLFSTPGRWFKLNTRTDTFEWTVSNNLFALSNIGAVVGLDGAIYLSPYELFRFVRISEPQSVDANRVLSRFFNMTG